MRTGKLKGQTKVMIPWEDTEGKRQYSMLTFDGDLYVSKMHSIIREFVKDNFKVDVDKDWLDNVPLVVNQYDDPVEVSESEADRIVEEFIQRMETDDEDEDYPDTDSTGGNAQEAEEPLPVVSDTANLG